MSTWAGVQPCIRDCRRLAAELAARHRRRRGLCVWAESTSAPAAHRSVRAEVGSLPDTAQDGHDAVWTFTNDLSRATGMGEPTQSAPADQTEPKEVAE